ncbi:MAG TPA: hypothetical protein VJ717_10870 [Gemmatimonadaceae bacterium]|nr:hypothetical protein [Gemmatimonadaceae bacterium]
MLLAAAILLILVGNVLQAHAVISHLREPRPSLTRTPDLYWNTAYYTPVGRRLVRLATWVLYPIALALVIVLVRRAVTGVGILDTSQNQLLHLFVLA